MTLGQNVDENKLIFSRFLSGKDKLLNFYEFDENTLSQLSTFRDVDFDIDRPDIVLKNNEFIIGIEHFRFDSYNQKKGSVQETQIGRFEQEYNDFILQNNLQIQQYPIHSSTKIEGEMNINNYVRKFFKTFINHYKKIDDYKHSISHKYNVNEDQIKVGFLIEDSTRVGTWTSDGKLLNAFEITEILDLLSNCLKLDFALFASYYKNDKLFLLRPSSLSKNMNNIKSFSCKHTKIIEMSPHAINVTFK